MRSLVLSTLRHVQLEWRSKSKKRQELFPAVRAYASSNSCSLTVGNHKVTVVPTSFSL